MTLAEIKTVMAEIEKLEGAILTIDAWLGYETKLAIGYQEDENDFDFLGFDLDAKLRVFLKTEREYIRTKLAEYARQFEPR